MHQYSRKPKPNHLHRRHTNSLALWSADCSWASSRLGAIALKLHASLSHIHTQRFQVDLPWQPKMLLLLARHWAYLCSAALLGILQVSHECLQSFLAATELV